MLDLGSHPKFALGIRGRARLGSRERGTDSALHAGHSGSPPSPIYSDPLPPTGSTWPVGTPLSPTPCWLGPAERRGGCTCRRGSGQALCAFSTSQPQVCQSQEHDSAVPAWYIPKNTSSRTLDSRTGRLEEAAGRRPTWWRRRQRQRPALLCSVPRALAAGLRSAALLYAALSLPLASPLPSLLSGFISQGVQLCACPGVRVERPMQGEAPSGVGQ